MTRSSAHFTIPQDDRSLPPDRESRLGRSIVLRDETTAPKGRFAGTTQMSTAPIYDFAGKVVTITGSSRGLGHAMAIGFARAGASVAIASRKLEAFLISHLQLAEPADPTEAREPIDQALAGGRRHVGRLATGCRAVPPARSRPISRSIGG